MVCTAACGFGDVICRILSLYMDTRTVWLQTWIRGFWSLVWIQRYQAEYRNSVFHARCCLRLLFWKVFMGMHQKEKQVQHQAVSDICGIFSRFYMGKLSTWHTAGLKKHWSSVFCAKGTDRKCSSCNRSETVEMNNRDTKEIKWVIKADYSERSIYFDRIDFLTMLEELEFRWCRCYRCYRSYIT